MFLHYILFVVLSALVIATPEPNPAPSPSVHRGHGAKGRGGHHRDSSSSDPMSHDKLNNVMADPVNLQQIQQAKSTKKQVKNICRNVKSSILTGLPVPNSIFTKTPDFDKMLSRLRNAQTARQGNGNPNQLKVKHDGGKKHKKHKHRGKKGGRLLRALAIVTGIAIPKRNTSTPEEKVAFAKAMFNRLLSQPWTDAQTIAFWQAFCLKGNRLPFGSPPPIANAGRQPGTSTNRNAALTSNPDVNGSASLTPDTNTNGTAALNSKQSVGSGAQAVVATAGSSVVVSLVLYLFL